MPVSAAHRFPLSRIDKIKFSTHQEGVRTIYPLNPEPLNREPRTYIEHATKERLRKKTNPPGADRDGPSTGGRSKHPDPGHRRW